MKLFSYLAFFCFLETLVALGMELYLDPRSSLNRAGAFSSLFYSIWAFCMIFVYGGSPPVALVFSHFYYLGSLYLTPSLLWFYLTIAGFSLRTKLFFCLPSLAGSTFVYWDFLSHGFYYESFRDGPWGNVGVPGNNRFWGDLAPYLALGQIVVCLGLMVRTRRRSKSRRMKGQIDTLVVSILVTFVLYFLGWYSEVYLGLPNTMVLSGVYLVTATFFMVVHYRFLQRDYPLLERHVPTAVQDSAFLLDNKRRVLGANPAALRRFNLEEPDLIGRDLVTLVDTSTILLREWDLAANGRPLHRWLPCRAGGKSVFLSLSSRFDIFGDFVGAVVLLGDLFHLDAIELRMGLTEREREIVLFVLQEIDNHEIADLLSISPGTVKRHLHNIYNKTGAANKVQLFNLLLSPVDRLEDVFQSSSRQVRAVRSR